MFQKPHIYVGLLILLTLGALSFCLLSSSSSRTEVTLELGKPLSPTCDPITRTGSKGSVSKVLPPCDNEKFSDSPEKTKNTPAKRKGLSVQNISKKHMTLPNAHKGLPLSSSQDSRPKPFLKTSRKITPYLQQLTKSAQTSPSQQSLLSTSDSVEKTDEESDHVDIISTHEETHKKTDQEPRTQNVLKEGQQIENISPQKTFQYKNPDNAPEIVLIVQGLGRRQETLELALDLPPEVTLAFHSFEDVLPLTLKAQEEGHETLLLIPMEPKDYPANDPGPMTLLTGVEPSENINRLEAHLKNTPHCIGILPFQGTRFLISEKDLIPVFDTLKQKKMIFIDATHTRRSVSEKVALKNSFPYQKVSYHIGQTLTQEAILKEFKHLEEEAIKKGRIYVIAKDVPLVLSLLKKWSETLNKTSVKLAPVSVCFETVS